MAISARILPRLAAACCLWPVAALALPPLEQLETRLELSPAAQLAERSYESSRDTLGAGRIGLGVSAFGNLGYEHNHDIIDPQHSWTYTQGLVGGGLSMPLLGSRLQLEHTLSEQQVQLEQLDARRQLSRASCWRRLRRRTATTGRRSGGNCSRGITCRKNPPSSACGLRTRAGLLLDADRLELLSGSRWRGATKRRAARTAKSRWG